jgi:carboxynorspermidine decarboxylase
VNVTSSNDAWVSEIRSPAFVIELEPLEANCQLLARVQKDSGAKILLALKGFAAWSTFGMISKYLSGITSSGPFEAKLGKEHFAGEVHCYAPVYSDRDIEECLEVSDHIIFNSFTQWERYRERCEQARTRRPLQFGMRINPEHSEVKVALYDPCRPGSRLGVTRANAEGRSWAGLDGLHFHTLCELDSDALERTLRVVEANWADALKHVKWVNFGGGHHITRPGYDLERLVRLVREFRAKHGVEVYLEPGEAIALNAGVLVGSVLDVIAGPKPIAMLDVSATAHMPDVLEMPYRPRIALVDGKGDSVTRTPAGDFGATTHSYQLGGVTCLAGDMIGDYSFHRPLQVGDRLVFSDMAIYTMVKTTMFNGVRHPDIALLDKQGAVRVVREFGYLDYANRLS